LFQDYNFQVGRISFGPAGRAHAGGIAADHHESHAHFLSETSSLSMASDR